MRRRILIAIGVLLLLVTAAPALANVRGEPSLSVTLADDTIAPGEESVIEFDIQNRGSIDWSQRPELDERVTTARGVTVEIRDADEPIDVRTGTLALGSIRDGSTVPAPIRVFVPADAAPGEYDIDIRVRYEHIYYYNPGSDPNQSATVQDRSRSQTFSRTITVEEEPDFDIEPVDSAASIGDTGPVTFNVTNTGSETVHNARVTLTSENPSVTFAGATSAREQLGTLEAGETRAVTIDADVTDDAQQRNYSVGATIAYDDTDGISRQSDELTFGFSPDPERSFDVRDVESTLRVGEDGDVSGTFENTGEAPARNVVIRLETENPNVNIDEPEIAVGDLSPAETADFSFDVDVSNNAQAGVRQFTVQATYRNVAGDRRQSDPLDARVEIGPKRDEFAVEGVDATFQQGERGTLTIEVTNNLDEPVSDVSAKLFTDTPLSSDDDEAFADSLEPGESETLIFGLAVGDGALSKTYPARVDFRYETVDGDTRISDTYNVPVRVIEGESGGVPTSVLVGGLLGLIVLTLVGGGYWYRKR